MTLHYSEFIGPKTYKNKLNIFTPPTPPELGGKTKTFKYPLVFKLFSYLVHLNRRIDYPVF